jgi:DNA-binding NtrC family response regulator
MNPASRVPAAEKEFHVEATLTAAGHKAKVVESEAEVEKALESGKYDLVLADVVDVPNLRKQCGASASRPAVLPLLYKPTPAELSAAEKEANCLVRPSKKSSDLLAVIDETMRDRSKGIAPNCPTQ